MGKRKIEIERIQDIKKRDVTFSKRRKGLFKKAAAACRLYCSEIAIVVFSRTGKPYSFGYSSVDSVIDRFLINNKFNGNQRQLTTTVKDDNQVVLNHKMMKTEEENSHDDDNDDIQKNNQNKDEDEEVIITTEKEEMANEYLRDGNGYSCLADDDFIGIP